MVTNMKLTHLSATITSALILAGCGGDSSNSSPASDLQGSYVAAVLTTDFGDSSVALFGIDDLNIVDDQNYPSDQSDYFVAANGNELFHIGRNDIDLIQKYSLVNPAAGSFEGNGFSLQDAGIDISSNAHDIAFINDEKAYITRYGRESILIVNPEAQVAADFRLGSIDLSDYIAADSGDRNNPRMDDIVLGNSRAYVSMQRLGNAQSAFAVERPSYLAVIDTDTNTEIDTNTDTSPDNLDGIPLEIFNVQNLEISGRNIYAQGLLFAPVANGHSGVERINTETFESEVIYDDSGENPSIWDIAVINDDQVYVAVYHAFGDNSLARLNEDGSLTVVEGFDHINIRFVDTGPEGNLWVGVGLIENSDNPNAERNGVFRLNKDDLTDTAFAETALPANNIAFIRNRR